MMVLDELSKFDKNVAALKFFWGEHLMQRIDADLNLNFVAFDFEMMNKA